MFSLIIEYDLLRRFLYAVISVEVEALQVKPMRRGKWNHDLVVKECVVDKPGVVVVHEYLYDNADYLPDLMVDETLPFDDEFHPFLAHFRTGEVKDVPFGLGVFGFDVLGVVMEVVCAFEFLAAEVYFLHQIFAIFFF